MYKVGYGIISQQAKEAKHSGVKNDLALSNRSTKLDSSCKWWQVIRANYVQSIYLPEHQPMPCTYKSHFKSRVPPHCKFPDSCNCGWKKPTTSGLVECCEIVKCAKDQALSPKIIELLISQDYWTVKALLMHRLWQTFCWQCWSWIPWSIAQKWNWTFIE